MEDSRFVSVYRGHDPASLDLVEGLLRSEGFEYRRLGRSNGALVGAGSSAIEQVIQVLDTEFDRARELIEAGHEPVAVSDSEATNEATIKPVLFYGLWLVLGPSAVGIPILLAMSLRDLPNALAREEGIGVTLALLGLVLYWAISTWALWLATKRFRRR